MDSTVFRIESLQEARTFEDFLNRYGSLRCGGGSGSMPADYFSALFTYSREHRSDGRLLAAVLDLELTYLFMHRDVGGAAGTWNKDFTPRHPQPASVLHRFQSFAGKIDILYFLTALALRCRSFWDKYMGVLFLLHDEDNYDRFMGAKSRKRFFERHAKSWTAVSPHIRQCLTKAYDDIPDSMLNRGPPDRALGAPLSGTRREVEPVFPGDLVRLIDALDRIRTAEAHGTGTLRKWSLAMQPLHESKDFSLIHHWNIANSFMHHVEVGPKGV